jgi:hypothetical protein
MALSHFTVLRGVMWGSFVPINIGLISNQTDSREVMPVAIYQAMTIGMGATHHILLEVPVQK